MILRPQQYQRVDRHLVCRAVRQGENSCGQPMGSPLANDGYAILTTPLHVEFVCLHGTKPGRDGYAGALAHMHMAIQTTDQLCVVLLPRYSCLLVNMIKSWRKSVILAAPSRAQWEGHFGCVCLNLNWFIRRSLVII